MFGRALFALVWLIIAAGLLLPMYPRGVETPSVTAAGDTVQLAATTETSGCQDCPIPDAGDGQCQSGCRCGGLLPATFVTPEHAFRLTILVTVRSLPSRLQEPQPLPPKLPAI